MRVDLVIRGGRVLDPRSGLDAVQDVGIADGRIVALGEIAAPDARVIDATGLVVAPGFIDLHSHAQSPLGLGLQAHDGVTTALDLESGTLPIELQYAAAEREGRPINYGFSASWAVARMHVMAGVPLPSQVGDEPPLSALELFQRSQAEPGWHRVATESELDRMLGMLGDAIAAGGLGIGVLLGYAPGTGREEYFRLAQLAERTGTAAFTHSRRMSNLEPDSSLDAALEIIGAAAGSGAHLHICHINSTSLRRIDDVADAVWAAQGRGTRVSTEAYPYTMSNTGIGAAFLAPDQLGRLGIGPTQITYLPTGRRVSSLDELAHLRATDPGGQCLIDYLDADDPADLALLRRSFDLPGTVVASDAMPLVGAGGAYLRDGTLPDDARGHPRSVGTFSRTFGWLVRELGALSLADAVLRTSTLPAELLADAVPALRTKGRIASGFDADLTVFDPATIIDRATAQGIRPSTGVRHLIVGGRVVIDSGVLVDTTAGRAIRGTAGLAA